MESYYILVYPKIPYNTLVYPKIPYNTQVYPTIPYSTPSIIGWFQGEENMLLTDYQTHRAVFKDREQTLPASPADAVFKEVKTWRTDTQTEKMKIRDTLDFPGPIGVFN